MTDNLVDFANSEMNEVKLINKMNYCIIIAD